MRSLPLQHHPRPCTMAEHSVSCASTISSHASRFSGLPATLITIGSTLHATVLLFCRCAVLCLITYMQKGTLGHQFETCMPTRHQGDTLKLARNTLVLELQHKFTEWSVASASLLSICIPGMCMHLMECVPGVTFLHV